MKTPNWGLEIKFSKGVLFTKLYREKPKSCNVLSEDASKEIYHKTQQEKYCQKGKNFVSSGHICTTYWSAQSKLVNL